MRNALLLDTNVWLDYYLDIRPKHDAAVRLIDGCINSGFTLLASMTMMGDFFFNLNTSIKRSLRDTTGKSTEGQAEFARQFSWEQLDSLLEIAEIVGADASDAWVAQKHRSVHGDFEDDLVIAAALRAQPDYLVTNDQKLLTHSPYATVSVEDAIKLLEL